MKIKIKLLTIFLLSINVLASYSQGFNEDKTSLSNFIKRMYNKTQFEGVKVIDDYNHNYFISLVVLEKAKYSSSSTMNRVAQVKARQQANTFFNGSTISSDFVIRTTESKDSIKSHTTIETIESIKESSLGFVEGLELLINFDTEEGKRMVFIFFREMKGEK